MRLAGYPDANVGDAEVTFQYDADGFRNPSDLTDWDVVVTGDSFTEGSTVGYEDLFTSRLAEELGVRVKNLGVSFTGPLSQVTYLEHYGKAPSSRHAVLAFFEGNDLQDLQREVARRDVYRNSIGPLPTSKLDELEPQDSFVLAGWRLVSRLLAGGAQANPLPELVNGDYIGTATPVPMTLDFIPPSAADVPEALKTSFDRAVGEFAKAAKSAGMKPWILYIPAKRRTLDGLLRYRESASPEMVAWTPTDLPQWVADVAQAHGVSFVDATPALAGQARAGVLPYNAIFDTHLDAEGNRTVAKVLADALRPEIEAGH